MVTELRIARCNDAPIKPEKDYVLYWMIANRRLHYNFALQRAVELAVELGKPVLILEALACNYKWASVRIHRFILQGMADNRAAAAGLGVSYMPYVEPAAGHASGLLESLASQACAVVTDDFPCFFLPNLVKAAARKLSVSLEAVDSNGLYPMRHTDRVFTTAFSFRNHLQKTLTPFLSDCPEESPLSDPGLKKVNCLPDYVLARWPAATDQLLQASTLSLADLPIDQSVGPAVFPGGLIAGRKVLRAFVDNRLSQYADGRNHPDDDASSGLSPYLHFGHVSAHEVFREVALNQHWSVDDLNDARETKGSREGWWGMSPTAESFLDELITWREIGYNSCCHNPDYDRFESLPDFALQTLAKHAIDPRPYIYSHEQLRNAETHDQVWNAAQTQLLTEGRMHNYLRMLWGKKILEWSETPQDALQVMIDLNNRYAVDGRNPNSYSGIFWVLGRYDRAWGPERPVYGKVRYMSSDSTRRKLKLKQYLDRYSPAKTD